MPAAHMLSMHVPGCCQKTWGRRLALVQWAGCAPVFVPPLCPTGPNSASTHLLLPTQQVLGRAMEVIRLLAANPDAAFSKREALVAVNGGLEKLADLKLKVWARELDVGFCISKAGWAWGRE